jgi:site-specific DNA-methyltransferase (adenine-specific)
MDSLFGKKNFRSEITWKRTTSTQKGSQHGNLRWGNNADILLYYAASRSTLLRPERKLTESEILDKFKLVDENGQRYYDDSAHIWSTPNMGKRPNLCYEWRGFVNPHPSGWRLSKERLEEEYQKGNIVIRSDGKLQRRKYLKDYKGASYGNIWIDISIAAGKERTGWPTQKPLALLERIIKASSNEGDVVLDPFCGCATMCVAAEQLGRQWMGIDISPSAEVITKLRLQEEVDKQSDLWNPLEDIIVRTDAPVRTDSEETATQIRLPKADTYKHELYGEQEGKCAGCNYFLPFRNMTIDHIVPQSKGGTDVKENLQLLCNACNATKGTRSISEFITILQEQGVRQK